MAIFFFLPFSIIKNLGDSLARDGSLESLTRSRFEALSFLRYAGVGLILLAIGAWMARVPGITWMTRTLHYLGAEWAAFRSDCYKYFTAWREERSNWAAWLIMGGLTILSAINKVVLLSKPMGHDESYTFIAFASRPLLKFIRDYHLPNNHIFHSILVHWSYQLFGDDTWAIRLPAFLAGTFLVPAAFLAGRRLFNQPAGLLAAGIFAVLPIVRNYSSSARGYTLLALSTLLLIYLGSRTLKEKNRLSWLLWVITAALGFYTIPIMLYPFSMVAAWMGISCLIGDVSPDYRGRYWLYLVVSGISAASLTVLLYLPVFIYSGINSITANSFVQPLTWAEFYGNMGYRLSLAWNEWHYGLAPWLIYLSGASFGFGVIFNQRSSHHRVPLLVGLIAGTGAVLFAQRVAPEPRVWFFAVTAYVLTAAGGLVGAVEWSWRRLRWPQNWTYIGAAGVLLLAGLLSGIQSYAEYRHVRTGNQGSTELTVLYLKEVLGPDDVIVVNMDEGPATWYYARRYGIPEKQILNIKDKDFTYAWILVSPVYGQDLESVLAATSDIDVNGLDLSSAELIHQEPTMDTYRVRRK